MKSALNLSLIPAPTSLGANVRGSEQGPTALLKAGLLNHLIANDVHPHLTPLPAFNPEILPTCQALAKVVEDARKKEHAFLVLGGDHSVAMGTWSGAANSLHGHNLGLIWIDAHKDAHTPQTSQTQNLHGMPLAHLLGHGMKEFTKLARKGPALLPENVIQIGTRSYESGEAEFLKNLGVRCYHMEEVNERGLLEVWEEALTHITKNTTMFGLSIDVDALDPADAPGVGCPCPEGLSAQELQTILTGIARHPQLIGMDLVELNPPADPSGNTTQLALTLLSRLYQPPKA